MSKDLNISKAKFIFGWVLSNLAAWIIFAIILQFAYATQEQDPTRPSIFYIAFLGLRLSYINVIIVGLLLGIITGSIQWLWLNAKKWNIQAFSWIFATTLGWGFATFPYSSPSAIYLNSDFPLVGLLLVGFVIGMFQAAVWRKSIRQSVLWVVANAFGMFALGLSLYGILWVTFTHKPIFRYVLYSIEDNILPSLYLPPKYVFWSFLWPIMVTLLGAIITSLPTGFLLYSELNSKNINISDENSVLSQSKTG